MPSKEQLVGSLLEQEAVIAVQRAKVWNEALQTKQEGLKFFTDNVTATPGMTYQQAADMLVRSGLEKL